MQADSSHVGTGASVGSALHFIYRGAVKHTVDAPALRTALARRTDLTAAAVEAVAAAYSANTPSAVPQPQPPVRPQLTGVDWSLGAMVSSSSTSPSAPPAPAPFVNFQLRVKHADGSLGVESVEMTVPQLKLFEAALRDALAAIDRA